MKTTIIFACNTFQILKHSLFPQRCMSEMYCNLMYVFFPVQRVTPWNVEKLRQAIINGPDVHPGATHYSDKVSTMKLPPTKKARIAIARKLLSSRGVNTELGKTCDVNFECKTVYRHMQDGDVVLVNRQVWTRTFDFIDIAYLDCF